MLQSLRIKNLALVEDLTWEVGSGLVCVTGETGAGKSMIVGALKLILGERSDRSIIRTGEESCTIEAIFRLEQAEKVNGLLEEAGFDRCADDELLLKRVMTLGGQNRQFANNSPATLATLKTIGQELVDLHGPHEHQSLLSRERQLTILDAYAGLTRETGQFYEAYKQWRAAEDELNKLESSERASESETELLRHQVSEIDAARLRPEEEEDLLQRFKVVSNSSRIAALAGAARQKLTENEDSILTQLEHLQRMLRDLERMDPSLGETRKGAETAAVEIAELDANLRQYLERLDLDPSAATEIEQRINQLESLKRKYGGTVEAVLDHRERASGRLGGIENRGDLLQALRARLENARDEVSRYAAALAVERRKRAPGLAREVASHLLDLGFKRSHFDIEITPQDEPGPRGAEQVDFLFAPNPGEPPKPLRLIASSGEISRLMLAVKSAVARHDAIPLLVFDEIDANVGGVIATAVGTKMAKLATSHQVIAITHMPQVAALAASHYEVTKEFTGKRTRANLRLVSGQARLKELARMLGGNQATAEAHARNLLASARTASLSERQRKGGEPG
ncbi:MAG: DNA repair protein RecN [Verrucomicrobiales bacterium]